MLLLKGIDISKWNKGLKMEDVKKAGYEFVIIRGSYTGLGDGKTIVKDQYFDSFYKQAKESKLFVGAYHFSCANTRYKGEAEAEFIYKNCLKGRKFEMPIYIDVESKWQAKNKKATTDGIIGFCEYLENKGYFVGVYSNHDWFNNKIDMDRIKPYSIWLAYWTRNKPHEPFEYGLWQNSDNGRITGKKVDTNICFIDYPKIIKKAKLNGFK